MDDRYHYYHANMLEYDVANYRSIPMVEPLMNLRMFHHSNDDDDDELLNYRLV